MTEEATSNSKKQKGARQYSGKIIINDGDKIISLDVVGKTTDELYDTFKFVRNIKKEPGKYKLELKIDE